MMELCFKVLQLREKKRDTYFFKPGIHQSSWNSNLIPRQLYLNQVGGRSIPIGHLTCSVLLSFNPIVCMQLKLVKDLTILSTCSWVVPIFEAEFVQQQVHTATHQNIYILWIYKHHSLKNRPKFFQGCHPQSMFPWQAVCFFIHR